MTTDPLDILFQPTQRAELLNYAARVDAARAKGKADAAHWKEIADKFRYPETGIVKTKKDRFLFIRADNGASVYCNARAIEGFHSVAVGARVKFASEKGERGLYAKCAIAL